MNLNKELHEALGYCWHELYYHHETPSIQGFYTCSCGKTFSHASEAFEHTSKSNPDYVADPRLVIREMMKREDWENFLNQGIQKQKWLRDDDWIELFMDTTGKLAQLALDWIKK